MSTVDRVVGCDLGSQTDWTALVVLDIDQPEPTDEEPYPGTSLRVVYTRRLRRMPWPAIADELGAMAQWPSLLGCRWAVDATGVGRPVVDLLRQRVDNVLGVSITSGVEVSTHGHSEAGVPKVDLISGLQVLSQTGRLTVDRATKDAKALREELLGFSYTITETGRLVTGASGSGHDDLVLALALGCWLATRDESNGAAAWAAYYRSEAQYRLPEPLVDAGLSARERARRVGFLDGRPPGMS